MNLLIASAAAPQQSSVPDSGAAPVVAVEKSEKGGGFSVVLQPIKDGSGPVTRLLFSKIPDTPLFSVRLDSSKKFALIWCSKGRFVSKVNSQKWEPVPLPEPYYAIACGFSGLSVVAFCGLQGDYHKHAVLRCSLDPSGTVGAAKIANTEIDTPEMSQYSRLSMKLYDWLDSQGFLFVTAESGSPHPEAAFGWNYGSGFGSISLSDGWAFMWADRFSALDDHDDSGFRWVHAGVIGPKLDLSKIVGPQRRHVGDVRMVGPYAALSTDLGWVYVIDKSGRLVKKVEGELLVDTTDLQISPQTSGKPE
jgi:hypothetical protein